MKGLTVKQPHAARIARGEKRVENRTWSTSYRGPLVIQSGVRFDRAFPEARTMPRGVIAVARSFAVHRADQCADFAEYRQWSDGTFHCSEVGGLNVSSSMLWHWTLYGVIPVPEPLPLAGRLGLWDVPANVELYVRDLMGETW